MNPLKNIFVAAALAVATVAPLAVAEAMPLPAPTLQTAGQSDVTDVAWRRVCNYRGCRRVWVAPRRVIRPRVVVRPRVIVRPRVVVRPRTIVRGASSAHVNWCLNRYRSYDPGTDQYLGYDGLYHFCNSPY